MPYGIRLQRTTSLQVHPNELKPCLAIKILILLVYAEIPTEEGTAT
jgi:hypothetical protein